MALGDIYCPRCRSTITSDRAEVLSFHEEMCNDWSLPIGTIKSVVQSETGELWTTVTLNEYMRVSGNYVPPKMSKFRRWRERRAEAFWYKLHRMADDHGACDARCC